VYVVYEPEGSEEPTRWVYNPRKLMSAEREAIERQTGLMYSEFTQMVIQGSSICRRALLFVMLKRDHPTTKWGDVDFAWDELRLEYSRSEYDQMIQDAEDSLSGEQRDLAVAAFRAEQETAYEDPAETGKAQRPVVD
jgi:hypothetical protein